MSTSINSSKEHSTSYIQTYFKERFRPIPWFIIPMVLFILGHGPSTYNYILLLLLFSAIFFFRTLDDFFCFEFDKENKQSKHRPKHRPKYLKSKEQLSKLVILSMAVFFAFLLSLTDPLIVSLNILLTFGSIILYKLTKKNDLINFVSLIKYPTLLFTIGYLTLENKSIWMILTTLFFVLREYIEEHLNKRSKLIEIIIISALISTKLYMRNI